MYIISHIMNKINRNVEMFGMEASINRIPAKVGDRINQHLDELYSK